MLDPGVLLTVLAPCVAAAPGSDRCPQEAVSVSSTTPVEATETSTPATTESGEPRWELAVAPYLWLASIDGSLTVDGREVDAEGGGDGFFGDPGLLGFMAYVEASRGPWSVSLDEVYVDADFAAAAPGLVDGDASISGLVLQASLGYRFADDWRATTGLRYYDLETELGLVLVGQTSLELADSREWIDPFVGVEYRRGLGRHAQLRAAADIGGFGLGSDVSWSASAILDWRLGDSFALFAGYRGLGIDFADGGGGERFDYGLTLYGPLLGLRFTF